MPPIKIHENLFTVCWVDEGVVPLELWNMFLFSFKMYVSYTQYCEFFF